VSFENMMAVRNGIASQMKDLKTKVMEEQKERTMSPSRGRHQGEDGQD
jgi:hypothetical protein